MPTSSDASERNKAPILEVLRAELAARRQLLEIGSGAGTHALHCAARLPHLRWQSSEMPELLPQLAQRLREAAPPDLPAPIALDVRTRPWPALPCDALFSANTLHIMDESAVADFFAGAGACLNCDAVLCVYGPFRYRGAFTTASNAQFDAWLRARDPASGIRDFETVNALAQEQRFALLRDYAMPANNQLLVWRRER